MTTSGLQAQWGSTQPCTGAPAPVCSHAGESPNCDPEWEARKGFMLNESIHRYSKNGNLSDSKQVKFVSHLRRSGKGQTWEFGRIEMVCVLLVVGFMSVYSFVRSNETA